MIPDKVQMKRIKTTGINRELTDRYLAQTSLCHVSEIILQYSERLG